MKKAVPDGGVDIYVPKALKEALHTATGRHWKRNKDGTKKQVSLNYWTRGRRQGEEAILKRKRKRK